MIPYDINNTAKLSAYTIFIHEVEKEKRYQINALDLIDVKRSILLWVLISVIKLKKINGSSYQVIY